VRVLGEEYAAQLRAKLEALDVRTPGDVHQLRVPGRSEFAARELGVGMDVVTALRERADALVAQHAWLKDIRTRG